MEHWFGLIASFIGRICVAAFLAGLSSTQWSRTRNGTTFLSAIAILTCLLLWEQKHRMKTLGGLTLAWGNRESTPVEHLSALALRHHSFRFSCSRPLP